MTEFIRARLIKGENKKKGKIFQDVDQPLIIHFISTSLESKVREIHRSSHAKNLINLTYTQDKCQENQTVQGQDTYRADKLVQYPHTLIPCSQQTFLDPDAPLCDEAIKRPTSYENNKSGKGGKAKKSKIETNKHWCRQRNWEHAYWYKKVAAMRISKGAAQIVN